MRKIKITTIIFAIILVTLVAFAGVYIKTQNRMENKVKEYALGRELSGGRVVQLQVVTEEDNHDHDGDGVSDHEVEGTESANPEDLTVENYETVKKTIENRLNNFGAQDYTISLNKENGTIIVELPEDTNTDTYVYLLTAPVKVQINEKDTDTELLNDSMVEKSLYTYTTNAEGAYQVYLELHLTQEGQAKVEEIKNNYAIFADEIAEIEDAEEKTDEAETTEGELATEETTSDEATTEEEQTEETKKIAILTIAGTEYDIDRIEKNKIMIKMGGQTTNTASVNNNIAAAAELATLISSGKYPVQYEIAENRFVDSDITEKQLIYTAIAVAIVMLIVFVVFTIQYKGRGFLASLSFIGFISILSLILRYTNVSISIEGIGAVLLTLIINIRINQLILRDGRDIDYKELALNLVPVLIITLVFCFARWSNLSSFGLIMFWGLALIAVYNIIVTKTLLKLKENK